jgi:hypothetical protein
MNKAKKRKLEAEAARGGVASAAPVGWGVEFLVIAFVVGLALGAVLGFNLGRDRTPPVVPGATLQQPTPAGTDAYGRQPGHEHYGHDHP